MRQAWGYNQDANNCCITGVMEVASKWSGGGGGGGGREYDKVGKGAQY